MYKPEKQRKLLGLSRPGKSPKVGEKKRFRAIHFFLFNDLIILCTRVDKSKIRKLVSFVHSSKVPSLLPVLIFLSSSFLLFLVLFLSFLPSFFFSPFYFSFPFSSFFPFFSPFFFSFPRSFPFFSLVLSLLFLVLSFLFLVLFFSFRYSFFRSFCFSLFF